MASLRQCQDRHLNQRVLPPFRELFLEIQVNKLINDYLLPSSAENMSPPSHQIGNCSFESKENKASSPLSHVVVQHATSNACNVFCGKPSMPFHEHHKHSLHESQHAQTDITAFAGLQPSGSHSPHTKEWHINLKNTKVNEQRSSHGAQSPKPANVVLDASLVALSFLDKGCKSTNLSRLDTFPCPSKAELQMGGPFNADTDLRVSAKKPPRPPKLPNSNNPGPNLTSCLSDMGTLSRRAKSEKKRHSSGTSFCALLCTLCFAVIMIGQGFWSQGYQGFAPFSTNTSSSAVEYLKTSKLVGAQQDAVANSENLLLSVERVKSGVQAEHPLHRVKHLDYGT